MSVAVLPKAVLDKLCPPELDPEFWTMARRREVMVRWERLTEAERAIIVGGKTQAEFGREFGISPSRVYSLKSRALFRLRRGLQHV